ncbi:hypothetical protein ACE3MZ_11570 [Paenibacillus sp. WLX1005]|uniref:hypothetical protein n=1 Tax=Paenibacillus sp. WLX1005 TaxID=3243766 RepID=UPI00398444A9
MAGREQTTQQRKTWWMIGLLSILTIGLVIWYALFLFDGIKILNRNVDHALFVQATPSTDSSQVYNGDEASMPYDGDRQSTSLSQDQDKVFWYDGSIYTTPAQLEKPLHNSSFIQTLYEWSRLKLHESR